MKKSQNTEKVNGEYLATNNSPKILSKNQPEANQKVVEVPDNTGEIKEKLDQEK